MANIVFGITGGIAAYKCPDIVNQLVKAGHEVEVIMTKNASHFVSTLSLRTVSKRPVLINMFDENKEYSTKHIDLGKWADLFVIAPATANIIGKMSNGIADDFLTTVFLAMRAKTMIFPAMNTTMFNNPIVKDNLERLKKYGILVESCDVGRLACGDIGEGKMGAIEEIIKRINDELKMN